MSRGHGNREQEILQHIKQHGMLPINDPSKTVSENSSRHRAAKNLEKQGLIGIIQIKSGGKRRSIAMTVEDAKRFRQNERRKEMKAKRAKYDRLRDELGDVDPVS